MTYTPTMPLSVAIWRLKQTDTLADCNDLFPLACSIELPPVVPIVAKRR